MTPAGTPDMLSFLDHRGPQTAALPAWVADFRAAGLARYQTLGGVPTPKVEAWKYTNLRPLTALPWRPATGEDVALRVLPTDGLLSIAGPRLVLVNGRFAPHLSSPLPDGVEGEPLAEALLNDSGGLEGLLPTPANAPAMAALNAAWLGHGLVVRFAAGVDAGLPVHVVQIFAPAPDGAPVLAHPFLMVLAEAGCRATVIESHIGRAPAFVNGVCALHIETGASLFHVLAQSGSPETNAIGYATATVAKGGSYRRFTLTTGLGLVRNELAVTLAGAGAECHLYGAYTADGRRHVDNTLMVDHAAPATLSRQVFKGVLDDQGRGVFQGRIGVHPGAQKSDGHQLHKALLLSPKSEVDCKPELEIYADDVKCSHGATTGEMDEDTLFYLRTRGLDIPTARALLIEAFLDDVIDQATGDAPMVSVAARAMVSAWLASRRERRNQT
ncbi:MAG: Fe-S cluster assembly protein SufD [Rhodospirillaceae bacterium]|nr:MAG: Fe-S cluster assembly protein SufD [Rhodospirillaceae bacterium]